MKIDEINIILAGIGGQGIIRVGRILSTAALKSGFHLYYSETHGMAQRGGAVVSKLRFGDNVYSQQIMGGQADLMIGLEPLEALRNLHLLDPKGMIIVNTKRIVPALASKSDKKGYPSLKTIKNFVSKRFDNVVMFDASPLAEKAGSPLTMNVVLLGAIAATGVLPIPEKKIKDAISEHVPKNFIKINKKAFELGYKQIKV